AGRVQSVALRLVCEREKEIQAFIEQEYWTVATRLEKQGGQGFKAGLIAVGGKKLGKFDIPDAAAAESLKAGIAKGAVQVASVNRK
ncbi:MAG: DNA topoisomerase I, partial [Deltaproteobacteria bacterium]|nr:DNA topoisomerase I [Deltaproteobacteria bacterium]